MKKTKTACGCKDKEGVDEISTTSAVPPVTVPLGQKPNYGAKQKKKDTDVWDDQEIAEIKESILTRLNKN